MDVQLSGELLKSRGVEALGEQHLIQLSLSIAHHVASI